MTDTDTTSTADKPADTPDADDRVDTPAAEEAPATGDLSDTPADNTPADDDEDRADDTPADDEHQGDENADTFPRRVVEKLRKENATLRDRTKAAEATVTALQTQAAEKQISAAGLKPAAVWAVAELGDVLDDAGAVDTGKLATAMGTAREQLGVAPTKRHVPRPGAGAPKRSGSGVPREKPRGFSAAFGPQPK